LAERDQPAGQAAGGGADEAAGQGENKKEPKRLRCFLNRIERRFRKSNSKNSWHIPLDESDFGPGGPLEDSNGGPWGKSPMGPVILWAKGNDKKVLAVGPEAVGNWVRENIKR